MNVKTSLRTKDIAQAIGVSVQQVRNYEASGFLPIVERSPSGYRCYTRQHLVAIKTAKQLMNAYGLSVALQIMQAVHQRKLANALALIDEVHADMAHMRQQLEQTLSAVRVLAAQLPASAHGHIGEKLRVGAAARLVEVRVSALRFWEQQGLLHPLREAGSAYRLYDEQQLRRLRIVVLLRQANYDFAAIRTTLDEIDAGQPQRTVMAVEQRRSELADQSWRCLEAKAALYAYIREFLDDLPAARVAADTTHAYDDVD